MSSDYIPRLRRELLRAGAAPKRRRGPALALRPIAVAAAVAALVAVAVIALPIETDERAVSPAGAGTAYTVDPPAAAEQTAKVIRDRLAGAGIDGAHVSVAGDTVEISGAGGADIATLLEPGRLTMFDWEPRGAPALTNADIARAEVAKDVATGEPVVALELTAHGQAAFHALTREVARRGAAQAPPGAGTEAFQHLAIAVDGRVISKPYINFQENPDGIDGAAGVHIADNLTAQQARDLASVLNSGPLPGTLH